MRLEIEITPEPTNDEAARALVRTLGYLARDLTAGESKGEIETQVQVLFVGGEKTLTVKWGVLA